MKFVTLQVPETAKSSWGRHVVDAIDRAATAGERGEPARGSQRLAPAALRVARTSAVLPQDLRLPVQEDTSTEQMTSSPISFGYRSLDLCRSEHRAWGVDGLRMRMEILYSVFYLMEVNTKVTLRGFNSCSSAVLHEARCETAWGHGSSKDLNFLM